MKKSLLFRLTAIMVFAIISLVLKSETYSISRLKCSAKNNVQSELLKVQNKLPFPPEQGFIIKI